MGSSAGFNRKIKITRPGSRDQKLKTGEMYFNTLKQIPIILRSLGIKSI